jgi:hypothetical protein
LSIDGSTGLLERESRPFPPSFRNDQGWLDRHPSRLLLVVLVVFCSLAVGAATALRPLAGLGLLIAIWLGLAVLRRPAIGGYVLVGIVPITSGLRSGFPVPVFRLSQLLVGVIGIAILVTASKRQAVRWRLFDTVMLVFCAFALIVGVYDDLKLGAALKTGLGPLVGPFQYLILYRAVAVSLPERAQRQLALKLVILASIPVSLLALLQQFHISGVNNFIGTLTGSTIFQSYSYHYFARATGPFNHWTPLAGYLLVVMLLGISLMLHEVEGILSRRVLLGILILDAAGLLLSAELSAMIAIIGGSLILGVWAGKLRTLLRWAVPIVIVLSVAFGSYFAQRLNTEYGASSGTHSSALVPQSVEYRLQVWSQQYIPAIHQRELLGYGTTLPASITWPDTESEYITELMWGGIPLLMMYLGLMAAFIARVVRSTRQEGDEPERWAIARMLAVLLGLLLVINSIFPYFTSSGLPQELFAIFGILVAMDRRVVTSASDRAPARPRRAGAGSTVTS